MNPLKCCDLSLQDTPFSEYPPFTQTNFSHNRNFNVAVAGPPLSLMNFKTVLSMMIFFDSLIRIKKPEDSSRVKDEYFNEEPNYYPRFGQTDPNSAAGKWRTSPAVYRI